MNEKIKNLATPIIGDGQLDQIGIVVADVEKVSKQYQSLLGIGPFEFFDWPAESSDPTAEYYGKPGNWKLRLGFAEAGSIQIELIQPVSGQSIFMDFLRARGPGLHHLRFLVPDVGEAIAKVEEKGFEIISKGKGVHAGSTWAYIDTRDFLNGVLIEIRLRLTN